MTIGFEPRLHAQHYIGGRWVPQPGGERIEVRDPFRGTVVGHVPDGGALEVSSAIEAATRALRAWAGTSPTERARHLQSMGQRIKEELLVLADLVTREVGTPIRTSKRVQLGLAIQTLGFYERLAETFPFEREQPDAIICQEPVGVIACITPWNLPLLQLVSKVAPALAAGCTVVVKPSELAPLTAFELARTADLVGLPAGVLNVVSGTGLTAGQALVQHPGVDKISFTGSTRTGRHVMANAARSLKRVTLELGGKSACVVLDDADPAVAAHAVVRSCMFNAGQSCLAWSRLLVPRWLESEVTEAVAREADRLVMGDPLDESTTLGPLISAAQALRVRRSIERGIRDGARLIVGGRTPADIESDCFVNPTVFCSVHPDMAIAQQEIFGPVLSIIAYDDEEQAIEIANGTIYGLHGGVFSGRPERATAFARRLRTGQVAVNRMRFDPALPLGGWKQSGLGYEFGEQGFSDYLQTKVIAL